MFLGWGIHIVQNLAWGYYTWDAAIQGWYDEVADFQYGVGNTSVGAVVGHYTQVRTFELSLNSVFFCQINSISSI